MFESKPHPVLVPKLNAKIVPPLRSRKKRTSFEPQQKFALNTFYEANQRPDFAQLDAIATSLGLDFDVSFLKLIYILISKFLGRSCMVLQSSSED